MPLRQVGERDASPSDHSSGSSPAHEAASDERPFNFPGLPAELKRLIAMQMDRETLQSFALTSWENHFIATSVAKKTAGEIYDAALAEGLPNVSWRKTNSGRPNPHKVSASGVTDIVRLLVRGLNDKRQTDFTKKLAALDPRVRAECLFDLRKDLDNFKEASRSRLLDEAVELLSSDDAWNRSAAAEVIAKAESQDLLEPKHVSRIEGICKRSDQVKSALEYCRQRSRENRDARQLGDARQLLADAEAIKDNPTERNRILAEAAECLEVDLISADRRMETYRRNQAEWQGRAGRKRGREADEWEDSSRRKRGREAGGGLGL